MSNNYNLFSVTVGDLTGDGHSMTEHFVLKTNFTLEQMHALYKLIEEVYHIDFLELCSGYEENQVTPNVLSVMEKVNYPLDNLYKYQDTQGQMVFYFDPRKFVNFFICVLKSLHSGLELEIYDMPSLAFLGCQFGYGLLSQ